MFGLRVGLFSVVSLLGTCVGYAQFAVPASVQKVQENAGTGPYENALQSGFAYRDPTRENAADDRVRVAHALRLVEDSLKVLNGTKELPDFTGSYNKLIPRLDSVSPKGRTPCFTDIQICKIRKAIEDVIESVKKKGFVRQVDRSALTSDIDNLIAQIGSLSRRDKKNEPVLGYKSGFYGESGSSVKFESLSASFGMHPEGALYSSFFLTASGLFPLRPSRSLDTVRFGAGFAYGDPNAFVATVGAASYLSPYALDAQLGMSFRYPMNTLAVANPESLKNEEVSANRTLLDHIRTGDVWLSVIGRQLSGSKSEYLANGQILEAEVTIAIEKTSAPYFRPTTISFSGIAASKRDLGVDELGFEVRSPIKGIFADRPVYVSGRYGTRGHFTVALEFRL